MRKRERENPCAVCGHYHKYEEGEICGVCGHRALVASAQKPVQQTSAFPSEILKDFLYLGSYDNASRSELLKTLGISCILNTVPDCQTLYKNSFTYHCLERGSDLQFDNAVQFLEQCERDKARVLVHCMSGKNRSPAIVIAYLMKCKGWRFSQSFQWVKERRSIIDLSSAVLQQLIEWEKKAFEYNESVQTTPFTFPTSLPSFGFGSSQPAASILPTFNQPTSTSTFEHSSPNIPVNQFVFGPGTSNKEAFANNLAPAGTEAPMDSF